MFNKITVIGLGYVGLGQAYLFNPLTNVIGYDIDSAKITAIKQGEVFLNGEDIVRAHQVKPLLVTSSFKEAITNSDLVIIATPTNFNENTNTFDLSSISLTLTKLNDLNFKAPILIKSTLSVGATERLQTEYPHLTILFSPEFLREGNSLHDNYYPSRIIVSYTKKRPKDEVIARKIGLLYQKASKNDAPLLITGTNEAEAIKLFSNTYLALRVAYFNELDTYALSKNLDPKMIIEGVGLDPRIGNFYNNPSFGYGGYCLPKDIRELSASFANIPQNLIGAIEAANATRKQFISQFILNKLGEDYKYKIIGVYRLTMKKDATNMRESSILHVVKMLSELGANVIIYEPLLKGEAFAGFKLLNDLKTFKETTDLIITNRHDEELYDVTLKVFTRDIFNVD